MSARRVLFLGKRFKDCWDTACAVENFDVTVVTSPEMLRGYVLGFMDGRKSPKGFVIIIPNGWFRMSRMELNDLLETAGFERSQLRPINPGVQGKGFTQAVLRMP